ncbi:heavy-metal-associated domain-containing protein [Cellulomonas fimi]|uniref:Heavy metal transport/detoxification protein n=1 Tax=Cellulomonas fimi (strain ATCC 484 / DSM 20113 / JCM 1341 / CCUG 24087 / LMG 16345 / NBRC 15513 / NCIMB 8980 / NCTC 7547 / NRS-133) TaxID=590998 RepID=F4H5Q0_CELFA|nr:heavy-metal-associated domain-containing protein [Cellulomonas fimi]AEE44374.1 Heavy metal transport/detoxification protein [Cellulomonas fimi ATCC 484]NNH08646.1 heavy-metal-associated domain-containing protein [Cellulomonas fimi]VEH26230.1 Copper-ion-binding protein [Cellulomonas fimi]
MAQTTTFGVDGMTCGHCVHAVTTELTALPGVTDVAVDLVVGGSSTVRVTSDAPLADDAVAEAVTEAGYAVTPRRSLL